MLLLGIFEICRILERRKIAEKGENQMIIQ